MTADSSPAEFVDVMLEAALVGGQSLAAEAAGSMTFGADPEDSYRKAGEAIGLLIGLLTELRRQSPEVDVWLRQSVRALVHRSA